MKKILFITIALMLFAVSAYAEGYTPPLWAKTTVTNVAATATTVARDTLLTTYALDTLTSVYTSSANAEASAAVINATILKGALVLAPAYAEGVEATGVAVTSDTDADSFGVAATVFTVPTGGAKITGVYVISSAGSNVGLNLYSGTTLVAELHLPGTTPAGYFPINSEMVLTAGATVTAKVRDHVGNKASYIRVQYAKVP